ncbi:hypothetical protein [Halegenticoccus tardaugens]|uniref:hypothetical protein n=1 Tax=Halegenticoccus tardaugens TaxID=2071624 RepID=UPI001E2D1FAB|nr:hypothetical protein [Halegenticoccus tardaugens]
MIEVDADADDGGVGDDEPRRKRRVEEEDDERADDDRDGEVMLRVDRRSPVRSVLVRA